MLTFATATPLCVTWDLLDHNLICPAEIFQSRPGLQVSTPAETLRGEFWLVRDGGDLAGEVGSGHDGRLAVEAVIDGRSQAVRKKIGITVYSEHFI